MDEKLQEKLTGTYREYREHLRRIADNPEMEQAEKMEQAQAAHRVAVDLLSKEAGEWSASLDEKAADLEKVLYHGNEKYRQAVRQLSDKSEQELEQAARIASRTGDAEMVRAAAVVAREKGHHQLFYDYAASDDEFGASYQELLEIPDHADREQYVRQFVPPPPGAHDVRPSAQEMRRREDARVQEQAARLTAQANARAAAGITLFPAPQQPRKFVGRSSSEGKGGDAA